ncbi:odorant receptor 49a-like [Musca vetustissima]|uniref:odorant receptor 49a-like n=1 Tax=Musca vetustissima TaxID=27455 RepID=UPI002AB6FDFC|nr:odorant receptor 49a-like [Musca vetustissima]
MAKIERFFEDFVNLPCLLQKTLGFDFQGLPRCWLTKFLMKLYFLMALLSCLYATYFVANIALTEILSRSEDLPLILRLIDDIFHNLFGIVKSLVFFYNLKSNRKLFERLKAIFPTSLADRMAYDVNAYFWPKWITNTVYMQCCAIAVIVFSPLAVALVEYFVVLLKNGLLDAEFGYHILYGNQKYIVDHHNALGYIFIYSILVMGTHYAVIFNISPDIWLVAYAIQLCMHFDYISRNLEEYEPQEGGAKKDLHVVRKLVRKHEVLLELAHDLRQNFSLLILVMLFSTVATLFGAGIYVLTQGVNSDILGYLAFLPTTVGQYFMVCYYGQLIINKSLKIAEAAYDQAWYNASRSYKKSIMVIMGRAQRQCEINAGGFQTTNLKAFEGVMRITFQLFTVWRSLMEKKSNK